MNNGKLHIINNSIIDDTPNVLYIDTSNENYPYLAYKKKEQEDGDNSKLVIKSVIEGETYDRPVHCSELFKLLLSMNPGTKFTPSKINKDLYYQFPRDRFTESSMPNSLLVTIPSSSGREEIDVFDSNSSWPDQIDLGIIKVCDSGKWLGNNGEKTSETIEIEEEIDRLFNNSDLLDLDNKELRSFGQYASDIKTGSRVLELVSDTTYTDTVDFNELKEKVVESDVSSLAEVSVSYTIKKEGETLISKKTFVFRPFSYISNDSSVDVPNLIERIGNDVQAEYFNGTLRVIPINNQVEECIIDNCTVTYGNI